MTTDRTSHTLILEIETIDPTDSCIVDDIVCDALNGRDGKPMSKIAEYYGVEIEQWFIEHPREGKE